MMKSITCPLCKKLFIRNDNEHWKKICYNCWKDYKWMENRIMKAGYKADVYIAHPSVTKEEIDNWIRENKYEIGWGAQEYDKKKVKIWINSTNYD